MLNISAECKQNVGAPLRRRAYGLPVACALSLALCFGGAPSLEAAGVDGIASDYEATAVKASRFAKFRFRSSKNHCATFVEFLTYVNGLSKNKAELLTVVGHVIIGKDPTRKGNRGALYVGVGVTNDSGMKAAFRDASPQLEHLVAGLLLANSSGPGGAGFIGIISEVMTAVGRGEIPSPEDALLYLFADDLGTRLSDANRSEFPERVRKVICK